MSPFPWPESPAASAERPADLSAAADPGSEYSDSDPPDPHPCYLHPDSGSGRHLYSGPSSDYRSGPDYPDSGSRPDSGPGSDYSDSAAGSGASSWRRCSFPLHPDHQD